MSTPIYKFCMPTKYSNNTNTNDYHPPRNLAHYDKQSDSQSHWVGHSYSLCKQSTIKRILNVVGLLGEHKATLRLYENPKPQYHQPTCGVLTVWDKLKLTNVCLNYQPTRDSDINVTKDRGWSEGGAGGGVISNATRDDGNICKKHNNFN